MGGQAVCFTIPGEPVAKGRHRTTKTGHIYTPEKTISYENLVKLAYMDASEGGKIRLQGPIEMEVMAVFRIPGSASKIKRQGMMNGAIRPTKRPDIDNCLKAVMDGINGVAFDDDSQVVFIMVHKWYGDRPRVEVRLHEYEGSKTPHQEIMEVE